MIKMEVKGLKKINQDLLAMGKIDMTQGVSRACLIVEREAKLIVPVITGNLRDSINYRVEGNTKGGATGIVGSAVDYAAKIEFGGSRKAPDGYLGPALRQNRDKIKNTILRYIRKEVARITK